MCGCVCVKSPFSGTNRSSRALHGNVWLQDMVPFAPLDLSPSECKSSPVWAWERRGLAGKASFGAASTIGKVHRPGSSSLLTAHGHPWAQSMAMEVVSGVHQMLKTMAFGGKPFQLSGNKLLRAEAPHCLATGSKFVACQESFQLLHLIRHPDLRLEVMHSRVVPLPSSTNKQH